MYNSKSKSHIPRTDKLLVVIKSVTLKFELIFKSYVLLSVVLIDTFSRDVDKLKLVLILLANVFKLELFIKFAPVIVLLLQVIFMLTRLLVVILDKVKLPLVGINY